MIAVVLLFRVSRGEREERSAETITFPWIHRQKLPKQTGFVFFHETVNSNLASDDARATRKAHFGAFGVEMNRNARCR